MIKPAPNSEAAPTTSFRSDMRDDENNMVIASSKAASDALYGMGYLQNLAKPDSKLVRKINGHLIRAIRGLRDLVRKSKSRDHPAQMKIF